MLCKSKKKDDQPCENQATVTVFWPGQTTVSCDEHFEKQKAIATAMGFALDSRPVEENVEDAG